MTTMKRKRYTPEQAVRKVCEGKRMLARGSELAEVLRHLEVTKSTWNRWRRAYAAHWRVHQHQPNTQDTCTYKRVPLSASFGQTGWLSGVRGAFLGRMVSVNLPQIRSPYSWCPFKVHTYYDNASIGTATAFFYEHAGRIFVITNWHVVSGRHFLDKSILSESGLVTSCPSKIVLRLGQRVKRGEDAYSVEWREHAVDLFDGDQPIWHEHPTLGHCCDVVAIRTNLHADDSEFLHRPVNRISDISIPLEPGVTIFILGYPIGISVASGLAIWKSGYVASEPEVPIYVGAAESKHDGAGKDQSLPAFFVDSATRQGMSGSAVIGVHTGMWDPNNPHSREGLGPDHILGTAYEFIGCYSARVLSSELEAGLGICWPKDVIEEICETRTTATNPHIV